MQKITVSNYYEVFQTIDRDTLPQAFIDAHRIIEGIHSEGTKDFDFYYRDEELKQIADDYFDKLSAYLKKKHAGKKGETSANAVQQEKPEQTVPAAKKRASVRVPKAKPRPDNAAKATSVQRSTPVRVQNARVTQKHTISEAESSVGPHYTERIPEEIRFIKRYVNLNGKVKTKDQILAFVNGLQRAIIEKRIGKSSPYAKEILYVQEKLVKSYNGMKGKARFEIPTAKFNELKAITGAEKVFGTIGFIKKYIWLNGKTGMKQKAKNLLQQLTKAETKGAIQKSMPYYSLLREMKKNLQYFTTNKPAKTLEIEQAQLNGLHAALNGHSGMDGLNGLEGAAIETDGHTKIINSMDFANLRFTSLGFGEPWLSFIGDPSPGFTAMVYGRPKFGKSTLCAEWAGYLARHHGRVLYIIREEGINRTAQDKLATPHIKHPDLIVADGLPADLSAYDFIFLDSITKLRLEPQDLDNLKKQYPGKSFIYVFQVTKDGMFRGENAFQHDVDIVIEVPEWGRAVQYGRYNQGGEMYIFDGDPATTMAA
jgi:hypothetical protein